MDGKLTRKEFIKTIAAAGAGFSAVPFQFSAAPVGASQARAGGSHDQRGYPIQPVSFTDVQVEGDQFWSPKMERNAEVTLPYILDKFESDRTGPSELYKTIEGASYILQATDGGNPALRERLDALVADVAAAQGPDGYISDQPVPASERWGRDDDSGGAGELYELGHLYEAAVAHHRATGQRNLLDKAVKSADLLVEVFGWGKLEKYPSHAETELALVRLWRATGKEAYLELAKFFLDVRGPDGSAYRQAHRKLVDQREAVGHAVQATYAYSGMTDIAALTGARPYHRATEALWENIAHKKFYVTGGIGTTGHGEGFGENYELPNETAYNETCASIGHMLWSERMFRLHGEAKYFDVLERSLYNGFLSGVSVVGDRFFYPNPLASRGQYRRASWFEVACCPPNLLRFMATVPGYVYAQKGDELYVNLFMSNTASIELSSGPAVQIEQQTEYPREGRVNLQVSPERPGEFALKVRIPGWARGQAVPGDLYRFAESKPQPVPITVNGEPVDYQTEKGYAVLRRRWEEGDEARVDLPMEPRKVVAKEEVEANRGRFALQRGPLVYALEGPDHPGGEVLNMVVPAEASVAEASVAAASREDVLGGTPALETEGVALAERKRGEGIAEEQRSVTAIPYYLWANRGPAETMVWVPHRSSAAEPTSVLAPTLASRSTVRASAGARNLEEVNNQLVLPDIIGSQPTVAGHFRWPMEEAGERQWVQYLFERPAEVSSVEVYWYDEKGSGTMTTWYDGEPWPGCWVPESWRLYYRDGGGRWQPVEAKGDYGTERNQYNRLAFTPVKTRSLRIVARRKKSFPGRDEVYPMGIREWVVNESE